MTSSKDHGPQTVCVIYRKKNAYSETFIRAHVEYLPATVKELYGYGFPLYLPGDKPLLPSLPRMVKNVIIRFFPNYYSELIIQAFGRFLEKNNVDAVLAEYGLTGVEVMRQCRTSEVPLIVHFHGFDAYKRTTLEGPGKQYPELFKEASAIVAVSKDMVRQLIDLGAPREKVHLNPYGVDMTFFAEADPASAPPIFLAVGRFVDKKAPQITLLAFSKVLEKVPDARLIMIGDGPLLESCQQLARAMGIAKAVDFHGSRPHADIASTMITARAFVQHSLRPSNGDSEGTPVAVIEAGASGLPVVATRHAGIPDVVIEGQTGLLVDEGDAQGMAEAMIQLAENGNLAARMGKSARERIATEFTMEKSISNLWRIIENAIDSYSETKGRYI